MGETTPPFKGMAFADTLRVEQAQVLEMIAGGEPLPRVLEVLARLFETHADRMLASILLLEDGKVVRHGAAPSLPPAWVRYVDGQPIGPDRGSCGTAMFLKQPVIVSSIATDPHWSRYRDVALSLNLRACWSVPIMTPDQTVLGSFALYYPEEREPTPELLALAGYAARLATIAILHHRHEEALLESEARARLIVENALDANVLMDQGGIITGWNRQATMTFGWSTDEAIGQELASLIIPERYRTRHRDGLAGYLRTGQGLILNQRLEISALHKDGREFPVELSVTPITFANRVLFSAFIEDISASKAAEQALRDSQVHLSLVYDHVDDVLFQLQVDPDGYRFVSVNPAFSAATGIATDQVIGRLVHEVIPEPSLQVALARYAEALRTRHTVRWQETTRYPTGVKHGDVAITPVFDTLGQPKYLVGSVHDVTEQQRMENEVRQLQKLEAIGRLTGGIAHDFNNILGVIVGVGHMLLKDLETSADQDLRSQVAEIVTAGERGANLTRQFLAFGRNQMLQPEVLHLGRVVRDMETMLRRLIREDIALTANAAQGLWSVRADPGQIAQVVMNLVVNARDAMPRGGALTIETANADLNAGITRMHPGMVAGEHVMLSVSDTGTGMDEQTQARIFEPFFTTKEQGQGTGLGLATVYGIVKQSGGYIRADSRIGTGTVFTIYLPRTTDPEAAKGERTDRATPTGTARIDLHILVVEDEPALQRAIQRMLERLKYRVSVASSGAEALAMVTAQQLTPDVLITDMVMPGMSGSELASQLRVIRPDLKVLAISGYTDAEPPGRNDHDPRELFLQKPFTATDLEQMIRRITGP